MCGECSLFNDVETSWPHCMCCFILFCLYLLMSTAICCTCRVGSQNVSLPPVPGLEPVALPQSSQPSSTEASSSANKTRSAVYVLDIDIDRMTM